MRGLFWTMCINLSICIWSTPYEKIPLWRKLIFPLNSHLDVLTCAFSYLDVLTCAFGYLDMLTYAFSYLDVLTCAFSYLDVLTCAFLKRLSSRNAFHTTCTVQRFRCVDACVRSAGTFFCTPYHRRYRDWMVLSSTLQGQRNLWQLLSGWYATDTHEKVSFSVWKHLKKLGLKLLVTACYRVLYRYHLFGFFLSNYKILRQEQSLIKNGLYRMEVFILLRHRDKWKFYLHLHLYRSQCLCRAVWLNHNSFFFF